MLELFSQTTWNLGDNVMLTREEVNVILHKQFPPIRFDLSYSYSFEEIMNYIRKKKLNGRIQGIQPHYWQGAT